LHGANRAAQPTTKSQRTLNWFIYSILNYFPKDTDEAEIGIGLALSRPMLFPSPMMISNRHEDRSDISRQTDGKTLSPVRAVS
jgi:hypothetical protein